MPNLMQQGATWLGDRLKTAAGRSVVIKRKAVQTATITGWCAMHQVTVEEEDGAATNVLLYDWTFKRSDLVIGVDAFMPRDGDRIIETLNGVEVQYEAVPVGAKKAVEDLDDSGLLILVHTNKVA